MLPSIRVWCIQNIEQIFNIPTGFAPNPNNSEVHPPNIPSFQALAITGYFVSEISISTSLFG